MHREGQLKAITWGVVACAEAPGRNLNAGWVDERCVESGSLLGTKPGSLQWTVSHVWSARIEQLAMAQVGNLLRSMQGIHRIGVVSVGDMHNPSRQPALAPSDTVLPVPSEPYQSQTCKTGSLSHD